MNRSRTSVALAVVAVLASATNALAVRPTISGRVEQAPSADGRFLFHFTREGVDAVADRDVDPPNGLPDYVDDIIEGVRAGYDAWVTRGGWPAPPGDEGDGGDDRLDVYIKQITCEEASGVSACGPEGRIPAFLFGITRGERFIGGSTQRLTSFIIVNPSNDVPLGRNFARSVAAHALHHVIQFALDAREPRWVYEATAAFLQLDLFEFISQSPYIVDVLLVDRLGKPELSLANREGRIEYANALWFRYLVDRLGTPDIVRQIWTDAAASAGEGLYAAFEAALAPHGLDFAGALAEWGEWNYFLCGRDDGRHYDDGYTCVSANTSVRLDATYDRYPVVDAAFARPPEPMGMAYVELRPDGQSRDLVFDFAGEPGVPWRLRALRVRNDCSTDAAEIAVGSDGRASVRIAGIHDHRAVTLLAVNTDIHGTTPTQARYSVRGEGRYEGPPPDTSAVLRSVDVVPSIVQFNDINESATLVAIARFSNCTNLNVSRDPQAAWRSLDPNIASVDGAGVVTARARGRTSITAYYAGRGSSPVPVAVGPAEPPPPAPSKGSGCAAAAPTTSDPLGVAAVVFALAGLLRAARRRDPGQRFAK